jgi:DNA polymerase sigma
MLSKKEKGWDKPVPRNKHIICIEDPFDVEKDLGCYVDDNTIKDIRQVRV